MDSEQQPIPDPSQTGASRSSEIPPGGAHALNDEAWPATEHRFRSMADSAPAMLWVTDRAGYCTFLSRSWYEFTGQTEATGLDHGWTQAIHPDDRALIHQAFQAANAHEQSFQRDYRLRRHDGTYRWAMDAGRPHYGEDGRYLGYVGTVIDITERKEAEEALRRSEERLRLALDVGGMGTWELDLETGIADIDERECQLLGLAPGTKRITAASFRKFLHPEDVEKALHRNTALLTFAGDYKTEYRIVHPDGEMRWLAGWGRALSDAEGRPRRIAGVSFDVTELKEAEQTLRQLNETLEQRVNERTAQVEMLSRALTLAEQRERRRLSQVLHDDLQQTLFGLEMRAKLLSLQLSDQQAALHQHIEDLRAVIRRAVHTTRALSLELNPPVLRGEGLTQALRWLANHLENMYGLGVELDVQDDLVVPGEDRRVLVVQFVRELLFNVIQHAGVHRARLRAREAEGQLLIDVEDDGRGFNVKEAVEEPAHSATLGLVSIDERLRLFGGRLRIDAAPNQGARITIRMPLWREIDARPAPVREAS